MNTHSRIASHFDDAAQLFKESRDTLSPLLVQAAEIIFSCLTNNGKVLVCAEGGLLAVAQLFVAELVGQFERVRLPLAAIALGADAATLLAIGHQDRFDAIFERQVNALGQPGDVLVCLSATQPASLLNAVQAAHERDMPVISMSGSESRPLEDRLSAHDVLLCVPHHRLPRIKETYCLMCHALCDGVDTLLFGENE